MTDQPGTLTIDGDVATLTYRRRLPFPVEAVWRALTDPQQRRTWFGPTEIEPRAGGLIEMVPTEPPAPPEAKRMTGRILVWDPPRVFEHEWRQRIVEDSVVRYELTPDGDGTVLLFTHRGLSPHNARGFAPGSHAFLDRLAAQLAGAEPPNWNTRYEQLAPLYG
jgi:uncharacterized protein YndB with AHSA1/START domain